MKMPKRIFGSVFNRDQTIEERIATLQEVLSQSESTRQWAKTDAWIDIRTALESEISLTKELMVSHCSNTGANEKTLDRLWAYQHAVETLISIVETPLEMEASLFARLKQLIEIKKGTTGLPRPSDSETSPVPTP